MAGGWKNVLGKPELDGLTFWIPAFLLRARSWKDTVAGMTDIILLILKDRTGLLIYESVYL